MTKIVFVLTENIQFDGRVQKEINTLGKYGFVVDLIVDRFIDDNKDNYNFNIHVVEGITFKRNNIVLNFIKNIIFNFKVSKLIKKLDPDFVHCNDLNTLLSGVLSMKRDSVVYDAHELYVEKKKGLSKLLWRFIEYLLIPKVSSIIVPEKNRLKYLRKKYGSKKNFYLIENFPLRIEGLDKNFYFKRYGITKNKNIEILSYIGNISAERGIETVIKAVSMTEGITFVCIGPIEDGYLTELNNYIKKLKLEEKVFIKPPIKNQDVIHATKSSDIGMVFYENSNLNNYYCASNKLYEYITCKVPVLTNNYPGLVEVVSEVKCGINLDSLCTEEIVRGLNWVKNNELKFMNSEKYYWENQEKELLSVYNFNI